MMMSSRSSETGSALLAALLFLLAISALVALSLEKILIEKRTTTSIAISYQATLAAQSGLAAAMSQLSLATKDHPQFLVGETPQANILLEGATNLTTQTQLMPLISGDLNLLLDFPNIPQEKIERYLQTARDIHHTVDLNCKNHPIAASGSYWAPWVTITNNAGAPIARYAYRFFDEQARLNPALHQGKPRSDPDDWDQGPGTIPLVLENDFSDFFQNSTTDANCGVAPVLASSSINYTLSRCAPEAPGTSSPAASFERSLLFSQEEASSLLALADQDLLENGFASAFRSNSDFENKKSFLSRSKIGLPDFIPFSIPDGEKLKYDLNDLATNTAYGLTKSERAINLANIIDRNLPHFKERDPSLRSGSSADQRRYLNRLAACIVDYINPPSAATLVNGGEPAGQTLSPLATQIAERLHLQSCSSNSVTIESQYFVQVWNPYTKTIPSGGVVSFSIDNRPCLHFGTAEPTAFENYHQTTLAPAIRPNESVVLVFPTVTQTWNSPTPVTSSHPPYWLRGPEGNTNPKRHQTFEFTWNHQLVEMSRTSPVGPGLTEGGLEHEEGSLSTPNNYWHCNFIPTEQDRAGHFRFVGDPCENYLSNYLWKSYSGEKSYLERVRKQLIFDIF